MIGNSPPAIVEICFFQPCSAQVSVQRVVGLPTGRKGLGKKERERREKRGSGSIDEIARIFTLFLSPLSIPGLAWKCSSPLRTPEKDFPSPSFFPSFFLSLSILFSSRRIFSLSLSGSLLLLRSIVEGVALKFFVRTVR